MVKREMFFNDNISEAMELLNNFIEKYSITNIINIVEYRTFFGEYKVILFYRE